MRRIVVGAVAVVALASLASAQAPAARIEAKDSLGACSPVYARAPADKPFHASCILRGEADASGAIRATDAACDRPEIAAEAKACLENYHVTEAWRTATKAVCAQADFWRPVTTTGPNIRASTTVSWVNSCPPPGATRDPSRPAQMVITEEAAKNLPPGLLGPNVRVIATSDLPPEVQAAIARANTTKSEPLRLTQDVQSSAYRECFAPGQNRSEPFEQTCRVTAEVSGGGKIGKIDASCPDASLKTAAERCMASYKLMDMYRDFQGPVCLSLIFGAAQRTLPDGSSRLASHHGMRACEPAR